MGKRRGKGDGSVYQRASDDKWVGSARIGQGKRKNVYGDTRKEAVTKLKALQKQIDEGTLIRTKAESVESYLQYWLSIHRTEVRESSYQTYRSALRCVYPLIGTMTLTKLQGDHLQKMYGVLLQDHKPSRIVFINRILNTAFKDAVQWNRLSKNPCASVSVPKIEETVEEEAGKFLTVEQCEALLSVAQDQPLYVFIIVALGTGIRRGEVLALRWSDVNLEKKQIVVNKTVGFLPGDDGHNHHVESIGKTRSSRRTIHLADFVVDALKEHHKKQLKQRMQATIWEDKNLVLPNSKNGNFFPASTLDKQFKALLKKANLPDIHPHTLRHSCAVLLLSRGVSMKVVQEILGHSNIMITMNIYGHLLPGMESDAMSKMDDMFGPGQRKEKRKDS